MRQARVLWGLDRGFEYVELLLPTEDPGTDTAAALVPAADGLRLPSLIPAAALVRTWNESDKEGLPR